MNENTKRIATYLLKRHEGFSKNIYKCTAGKLTIGYGYNLESNQLSLDSYTIDQLETRGITTEYAAKLLEQCIDSLHYELVEKVSCYSELDDVRKAVLLDMSYNLGVVGLRKFKKTLALIEKKDFYNAGIEMSNSMWARQVGTRAKELIYMMSTGKEKS